MLSLEAVLLLPVLALVVVGLWEVGGLLRDVLLTHEAARAGVRAAATSSGTQQPARAARAAAPELNLQVTTSPSHRSDGDLVEVEVETTRTIGPVTHRVRASAVARVEPAVGARQGLPGASTAPGLGGGP
jgi:Flp pilus assembly protein TadG